MALEPDDPERALVELFTDTTELDRLPVIAAHPQAEIASP